MKIVALSLVALVSVNAACEDTAYKACIADAACMWQRPQYKRVKINAFRTKMQKVSNGKCLDKPATCAEATTAASCAIVTGQVCAYAAKTCSEVTDCSQAKTAAMCTKLNEGDLDCSYDKGYKRRRRWVRRPSCFATPASCEDATSFAACKAAPGKCAFNNKACVTLNSCSDAVGKTQCAMVDGCVFVPKYGKVRPNDQCLDAPTTCDAAPSIATCNGVTDQVCSYSKGACTQVTECAGATSAALCARVAGCSYDPGYKRGRRVIRKPSCATTPATCGDATSIAFCKLVDANCKYSKGACTEVTSCDQATTKENCEAVAGCTYTPRKRVGRRYQAATCKGPTAAPTLAPMTDAECGAYDGKKNQCQAQASRGCVWNAAKRVGRPDVKQCTDGRKKH